MEFRRESNALHNLLVNRLLGFERDQRSREQNQRSQHLERVQALQHEHQTRQRLWKTEAADAQLVLQKTVASHEALEQKRDKEADRLASAVLVMQEKENSLQNEIRAQSQQLLLSNKQLSATKHLAGSLEEQVRTTDAWWPNESLDTCTAKCVILIINTTVFIPSPQVKSCKSRELDILRDTKDKLQSLHVTANQKLQHAQSETQLVTEEVQQLLRASQLQEQALEAARQNATTHETEVEAWHHKYENAQQKYSVEVKAVGDECERGLQAERRLREECISAAESVREQLHAKLEAAQNRATQLRSQSEAEAQKSTRELGELRSRVADSQEQLQQMKARHADAIVALNETKEHTESLEIRLTGQVKQNITRETVLAKELSVQKSERERTSEELRTKTKDCHDANAALARANNRMAAERQVHQELEQQTSKHVHEMQMQIASMATQKKHERLRASESGKLAAELRIQLEQETQELRLCQQTSTRGIERITDKISIAESNHRIALQQLQNRLKSENTDAQNLREHLHTETAHAQRLQCEIQSRDTDISDLQGKLRSASSSAEKMVEHHEVEAQKLQEQLASEIESSIASSNVNQRLSVELSGEMACVQRVRESEAATTQQLQQRIESEAELMRQLRLAQIQNTNRVSQLRQEMALHASTAEQVCERIRAEGLEVQQKLESDLAVENARVERLQAEATISAEQLQQMHDKHEQNEECIKQVPNNPDRRSLLAFLNYTHPASKPNIHAVHAKHETKH